jgi:hypothetical protein
MTIHKGVLRQEIIVYAMELHLTRPQIRFPSNERVDARIDVKHEWPVSGRGQEEVLVFSQMLTVQIEDHPWSPEAVYVVPLLIVWKAVSDPDHVRYLF